MGMCEQDHQPMPPQSQACTSARGLILSTWTLLLSTLHSLILQASSLLLLELEKYRDNVQSTFLY